MRQLVITPNPADDRTTLRTGSALEDIPIKDIEDGEEGQSVPSLEEGQSVPSLEEGQSVPTLEEGQSVPPLEAGQSVPSLEEGQSVPTLADISTSSELVSTDNNRLSARPTNYQRCGLSPSYF